MIYEKHLDEVTTLLTEIYTLNDQLAIDITMRAQDDGYFSIHDDDPSICTQKRAEEDARVIFKKYRTATASPSKTAPADKNAKPSGTRK